MAAGREPGAEAATADRRLVVGIGASAGGLDAYKAFFSKMPADSGMAFVLVQHLDPKPGPAGSGCTPCPSRPLSSGRDWPGCVGVGRSPC